jgi:cobalt-zinc-cadmium efflux system outer membrane protein
MSRFLFLFLLGSSTQALDLSLPAVSSRVISHNPVLAAARLRIDEARGRMQQAGRLSNPEVGFEFKHDDRYREGNIGFSFDQKFPLTARLRLEKDLSAKEVSAAELEVLDQQRSLIGQAQSLAIKLLSLEQQRALRQQQSKLAQELSDFAAKRAEAGELSALDAAQAQVDAQRILLEGRVLETERVSLLGELKPLLGVAAQENLKISGELPKAAMPANTQAWEQRPDFRLSKLKEESAQVHLKIAKAGKWEDMSAGVFVEGERHEDGVTGLEKAPFFGIRFSIPLPLWGKQSGVQSEHEFAAKRTVLETKALALTIENEAAAARADMGAQMKLASDTKEKLLPLVLQQTDKLEKAYQQGQTDLLTVLRAREQRLQLEAAALTALRDFHLARIRYESATGQPSTTEN